MGEPVRLQKYLSRQGIASRRRAEEMILAGRVRVNGKTVRELGTKIAPGRDRVVVDGRETGPAPSFTYILLNKPKGVITTTDDPRGRTTVLDLLQGVQERVYPVGRLDYMTEGLLILTNDGEFTNAMTHPSRGIRKTYQVRVNGQLTREHLRFLSEGIDIGGTVTAPAEVQVLGTDGRVSLVEISITEGKNRQVRRMFEKLGFDVQRLVRTGIGPLTRRQLPRGKWRYLQKKEVRQLMAGKRR